MPMSLVTNLKFSNHDSIFWFYNVKLLQIDTEKQGLHLDSGHAKHVKLQSITSSAETEISLAFSSASWRMKAAICWICFETSASFIFGSAVEISPHELWWEELKGEERRGEACSTNAAITRVLLHRVYCVLGSVGLVHNWTSVHCYWLVGSFAICNSGPQLTPLLVYPECLFRSFVLSTV